MLHDQQPWDNKNKKREKYTKCLMPFIQLENQSKLTTFITKKRKVQESTQDLGPCQSSHSTWAPPGIQTENWRTRAKGQREGGYRARKGRRGSRASQFTSPKGPRGFPGEPKLTEFTRFSSTPICPQNYPLNKTESLHNSKHPVLRAQAATGKSKSCPSGRTLAGMASKISSILESLEFFLRTEEGRLGPGKLMSHPERGP